MKATSLLSYQIDWIIFKSLGTFHKMDVIYSLGTGHIIPSSFVRGAI